MGRFILIKNLGDPLAIPQITLHEGQVGQFRKRVPAVQAITTDDFPLLCLEELHQVRSDEAFSASYEGNFPSHSSYPSLREVCAERAGDA
jgi:hypothetical protein